MGSDKGALALTSHQQVLGSHLVDGLAHGTLTDIEANSKIGFAGYGIPRLPFTRFQTLQDQFLDLPIERTEGWRRRGNTCMRRPIHGIYWIIF